MAAAARASLLRRLCPLAGAVVLALALAGCARKAPPAPVFQGGGGGQPVAIVPPRGETAAALAPATPFFALDRNPDAVVVPPGETLYGVARRYNVPIRSVIEVNGLRPPYLLTANQRLVLPKVRQHVVQPGETLYSVSRRYGVDASALARTNDLPPPYTIKVGQALILPAAIEPAASTMVAARPLPPPPPPANPAPAAIAPPAGAAPGAAPVQQRPTMGQIPTAGSPPPPPLAQSPTPSPIVPEAATSAAPPSPPPPPAAAEAAAMPPLRAGRFAVPVRGRLVSSYGPGAAGTHNDGINIAAPKGTPVLAADNGTVAYAGNELRGFGNLVLIKHADGWVTAYAHCDTVAVKRGDAVRRGQPIATVGATGSVDEPQLHFEVRRGTRALDPAAYLPSLAASARAAGPSDAG